MIFIGTPDWDELIVEAATVPTEQLADRGTS